MHPCSVNRLSVGFATLCVLLAMPAVAQKPSSGTGQATSRQKSKPMLTPWGDPNLQGVWDFSTLTPMERPSHLGDKETFTEEEAAAFEQKALREISRDEGTKAGKFSAYNDAFYEWGTKVATRRTSLIVVPPNGRIPPLTAEAQRQRAARRPVPPDTIPPGGTLKDMSPGTRCIAGFNSGPPMTPGVYNNNVQLFQTKDHVVILTEMIHDARIVPLKPEPHLTGRVRQWMGDSRGRWDGQTLVVETTNFRSDRTPFGATANARLTERFTRVDRDTLMYEVTVDDPATWMSPWTYRLPMTTLQGYVYEYACHEGNYSLQNLLISQKKAAQPPSPR